jgi:GrpB-like predicted nucleotidyltransferase (UPF0157 family)
VGPIRIRPEEELRVTVAAAFETHRARISALLPDAEIEHVGSTSIPGALTKGDLDLLVRVDTTGFDTAVLVLRARYAVHQRENWTPTYASFVDPDASDPPVGVLLAAYHRLKLDLDGEDYEGYTDAKGAFVEEVLGRLPAVTAARAASPPPGRPRPGSRERRTSQR